MTLHNYSMQLFWSEEDQEYVAVIPEFPYLSALAATPEQAVHEAEIVLGLALDHMAEIGQDPPEPLTLSGYSGEIRVRMPRTLHRKLAARARMENVSLNTLMVSLLAEGIGAMEELPRSRSEIRRPRKPAAVTGESAGTAAELKPSSSSTAARTRR
jgi:predicted RNase H-like HicB family nuclease